MSAASFDLTLPIDIRVGAGRAAEAPDVVAGWGARRVLLVTGRSTERAGFLVDALNGRGIATSTYAVAGEPTLQVVRDGVAAAAGCDAVIGVGGGSALDVAKAVAVLAVSGADPLEHLEVIGQADRSPGPDCRAWPSPPPPAPDRR